jgi:hypothetical protein
MQPYPWDYSRIWPVVGCQIRFYLAIYHLHLGEEKTAVSKTRASGTSDLILPIYSNMVDATLSLVASP